MGLNGMKPGFNQSDSRHGNLASVLPLLIHPTVSLSGYWTQKPSAHRAFLFGGYSRATVESLCGFRQ